MRVIKYKIKQEESFADVIIDYNETNLEIAKKEAFNGEYSIEDVEE